MTGRSASAAYGEGSQVVTEESFQSSRGTGRLCGFPGLEELLFGCSTCTTEGAAGRRGFHRVADAWNADDADPDSSEEEGGHAESVPDKVDVVLRLIDQGPGSQNRQFFSSRGWVVKNVGGDRYRINERDVRLILVPTGKPIQDFRHLQDVVGWATAKRSARILIQDGPLRQPLLDYLFETGKNESYEKISTEFVGHERLVSFAMKGTPLHGADEESKLQAMRTATSQANERQKRASSTQRSSPAPTSRSVTPLRVQPTVQPQAGSPTGFRVS